MLESPQLPSFLSSRIALKQVECSKTQSAGLLTGTALVRAEKVKPWNALNDYEIKLYSMIRPGSPSFMDRPSLSGHLSKQMIIQWRVRRYHFDGITFRRESKL